MVRGDRIEATMDGQMTDKGMVRVVLELVVIY